MIALALAISLLSGVAALPPQDGDPQVGTSADWTPIRRHSSGFQLQTQLTFQKVIRPAMDKYRSCLNEQLRHVEPASADLIAAAGIHACGEVRKSALREADALLKADTKWPGDRRRQSIESTFAQLDAIHHEYLAHSVKLHSGTGQWREPMDLSRREVRRTIDIETPKAMTEYRLCLTIRDGLGPKNKPAVPPPDFKIGADCTPYRNKAVAEFDDELRTAGAPDEIRRTFIEGIMADADAKHAQSVALAMPKQKAK
jgi:hypothetical protein